MAEILIGSPSLNLIITSVLLSLLLLPIPSTDTIFAPGQVFIANGWKKPDNFCDSAWDSISPFVMTLAHGGENFYNGWMKNKKSAMISCNDGFRPVSFFIEALEEDAD